FGKKWETVRVSGLPEQRPQTQNKERNYIMKNRNNILTYIIAAVAILVTSASSSLGAQPQVYLGKLTHGEFVSCEGQILDPPAYAVGGTWVLSIDAMTQPLVPPPAH
ncbi:MAG: hypothetical protein DME59_18535, partial [Verrucomicrobia bacterium]